MPYRPEDLAAALQEGDDVIFGAFEFKGIWDRESQAQDLGDSLAVMGVTETLTYATAEAPGLKKGSVLTIAGQLRTAREVRLVGDGALSMAWLEKP